jgi:hypothetical protein
VPEVLVEVVLEGTISHHLQLLEPQILAVVEVAIITILPAQAVLES